MGYDGPQNGVGAGHMLPIAAQYGQYQAQVSSYPLPATSWHGVLPQYVMQPAPHMSQVEVPFDFIIFTLTIEFFKFFPQIFPL